MSNRFRPFFLLFALLASVITASSAGAVNGTEPVTTVAGGNGPGSASNQLTLPMGITVDTGGNLYIADSGNHRIQIVTSEGTVTTIAGGNGQGSANNQLHNPSGVTVDADGNLYIADADNHRIQKRDSNGTVTTIAGGNGAGSNNNQLSNPFGIDVDSNGTLYIADQSNHRIQKVTSEGTVTTIAGGNGQGSADNQFNFPTKVTVDPQGNVYITDTNNHRVQKRDSNGTITTIAGGNGQGSANNQLSNPFGIDVDSNGSLYIADFANYRVQKLTADNTNPTINITTPTHEQSIVQNTDLNAAYSCEDNQTLSTCTATLDGTPISSGDTINTSSSGSQTLTVTAADASDNVTTKTVTFTIHGPREIVGSHAAGTGNQGSISRLYMAVFQRQPDNAGHTYWNIKMSEGMSLQDAAYHFVTSTEFVATYADLDNQEFVELLYQNVMNRQGETAGVTYWTGILNTGTSRAAVTLLFSESAEFKRLTKTS